MKNVFAIIILILPLTAKSEAQKKCSEQNLIKLTENLQTMASAESFELVKINRLVVESKNTESLKAEYFQLKKSLKDTHDKFQKAYGDVQRLQKEFPECVFGEKI